MEKLLYIYPALYSFVRQDEEILSEKFRIVRHSFPAYKKWLLPLLFVRQFFFLLLQMPVAGKVVVSFAGYHSILPVVFGRFFKKPVFVILHGNDAASIPSLDYGNFRKWPLSWCTAFSVKNATKLLPVSKHLINTKLKGPARKMEANQGVAAFVKNPAHHEVIHNGFDSVFWKNVKEEKNKNLCVACATPDQYYLKGIDLIEEVAPRFPQIQFEIAGLQSDTFKQSKNGNVKYLPFFSREELREKFSSAAYYLQLSRWEGFGCALCEAMLCECVPIVSNVNMLPEIVGENGIVLQRLEAEELDKALCKLFSHSQQTSFNVGIEARQYIVQKYSLAHRKQAMLSVLVST